MLIKPIEDLVIHSVSQTLDALDPQLNVPISRDTTLFGAHGVLTSMELVSLIVDLEEHIATQYGISLILADERAMSQHNSPFRTVASLTEYISILMAETHQRDKSTSPAA